MIKVLNIFKALSDKTRLKIVKLLEDGELCVCAIVAALDMVQPKVSFHLNVLKDAGLIKDRKQGRWIHYRLDDSDMFRRFLILSVIEKMPKQSIEKARSRLARFLEKKRVEEKSSSARTKQTERS